MKNQDTLRNILISGAVVMLVLVFAPRLLNLPTRPTGADSQTTSSNTTDGTTSASGTITQPVPSGDPVTTQQAAGTGAPAKFVVQEAAEEQSVELGSLSGETETNDKAPSLYRMHLVISNHGGGSVESATLSDHKQLPDDPALYELLSLVERDDGRRYRSLCIEKISVDNEDLSLSERLWHADPVEAYTAPAATGASEAKSEEGQRVSYWINIVGDDGPVLKLTRTLSLPRQPLDMGRHDLRSELQVENLSDQPHTVVVTYRGGVGMPRAGSRMEDRAADVGIDGGDGRVSGTRVAISALSKTSSANLYQDMPDAPGQRLSWTATGNMYFTCTLAPPTEAEGGSDAGAITDVKAVDLDADSLTLDDMSVRLATRPTLLPPGDVARYPVDVYLGEKNGAAFSSLSPYRERNYYYQVSKGFGACTFTWLTELMLWLLNSLFSIIGDFGIAIIILVLVVRTCLHPITKKGQINMVRMQEQTGKLAPKMAAIKKKYASDKARQQQETMKLYREEGLNPATQVLTCLPMVIQMPIWIALYMSLQNNILMRHEPLHFTWIHDLTAPDALYTFAAPLLVPIMNVELPSFNLLPILVAVFMYTQQKLQPKPEPNPNMSDQQRQQQDMMRKMMPMMSIMMLVIFYKMPAGLNLYIMSSSLFGTIEQHRIRKHIKAHKEAGTLDKSGSTTQKATKKDTKPSWFGRLQQAAEDAQKKSKRGNAGR